MANCPISGVIWQHLHYIVGLQRLGHEVYYIEDTSRIPYDPVQGTPTEDYSYAAGHSRATSPPSSGSKDRWAFSPRYKTPGGNRGAEPQRSSIAFYSRRADALLNHLRFARTQR